MKTHIIIEPWRQAQFVFNLGKTIDDQPIAMILEIGEHASVDVIIFYAGEQPDNKELHLMLQGSYARARVYALYVTQGTSVVHLTIHQHHSGKQATSSVVMRAVSTGSSCCSYTGMMHIQESALGSKAHQEHKALLLSPHARAIAQPMLQALTNDVQCGHGSAVGVLDDQQIFYMQLRGLHSERARSLLLESFCMQAFDGFGDENMKQKLLERVRESVKTLTQ